MITPAAIQRLHPKEYYRRFLEHNVRPDARLPLDSRNVSFSTNSIHSANGSCLVKFGNTTLICVIKAEVTVPVDDCNRGIFVPNLDLPPLCGNQFKPGPPCPQAQAISNYIHQLSVKSPTIDLESLCIQPDVAVWVVYADIVCLCHDGNLFDAAIFALSTALRTARLPKPVFNEEDNSVHASIEFTEPLHLLRFPLACSFINFDKTYLIDPALDEEELSDHVVTVIMDADPQRELNILGIYKPGGILVSMDNLKVLMDWSKVRVKELYSLIQSI